MKSKCAKLFIIFYLFTLHGCLQHLQKEKYEAPALAALELAWPVVPVLFVAVVTSSVVFVSLLVWLCGLVLGTGTRVSESLLIILALELCSVKL